MAKTDNLSDFLTDVANSIRTKTQTSEPINAQDFSDKILSIQTGGGVARPTLFAPTTSEGINVISWKNNNQNGGFPVTVTAEIDNTTYTSPLYITEALNNKTLSITASSTNFNDAITTKTLNYISAPDYNGGIVLSGLNTDDANVNMVFEPHSAFSIINITTSEQISTEITLEQTDGAIRSDYAIRKNSTTSTTWTDYAVIISSLYSSEYASKSLNVKAYKNGMYLSENTISLSSIPADDNYNRIIDKLAMIKRNTSYYEIVLYNSAVEDTIIAKNDLISFQLTLSDPA